MSVVEKEVLKTKKNDFLWIDPANIVESENFNVRLQMGDLQGLSDSIVESGQIEPIQVVKTKGKEEYTIVDGHRRFSSIKMARYKGFDVPYVKAVICSGSIEDRIFNMVITGTQKLILSTLEEGEAYKRLIAHGYEIKDIAKRVGKSLPHVYSVVKLADVPKAVKNAITNGSVSATTVSDIIRNTESDEEVVSAVKKALDNVGVDEHGKQRKVKKSDIALASVMAPVNKMKYALEILDNDDQEAKNSRFLFDLLLELSDKESTPESIADLFR